MGDCREVTKSIRRLESLPPEVEKEHVQSMSYVVAAGNVLVKGKAFTWMETLDLLEELEYCEKIVNERKSAKVLREDLLAEKQRLRASASQ